MNLFGFFLSSHTDKQLQEFNNTTTTYQAIKTVRVGQR